LTEPIGAAERLNRWQFEGLRKTEVLGTFDVIRGYASIFDLAAASVATGYEGDWREGRGYQRSLSELHVEAIERFLSGPRYRFFPELIFGLRTGPQDRVVRMHTRRDLTIVELDLDQLADRQHPLRRIDGNHRLEAARRIAERTRGTLPPYSQVPFCFVVLSAEPHDDLTEAMLFNLINSKALPMVSEHSLSVLMQDEGTTAERFAEDPQLFLTRAIRDTVDGWPARFLEAMGSSPLTQLHRTSSVLMRSGEFPSETVEEVELAIPRLFEPLSDLAARLNTDLASFVSSSAFLPVAAHVYAKHTTGSGETANPTVADRLNRAERWLREFARWFATAGGKALPELEDPTLLWDVFYADFQSRAGQVFVALSFSEDKHIQEIGQAIDEALASFNASQPIPPLSVGRADKQLGASYEIPAWVFDEIRRSRLVIADLTEERPNVYMEVGYALSAGIPLILTFHKRTGRPPWDRVDVGGNKVAFDLAAFRYVGYDTGLELRDKLVAELRAYFSGPPAGTSSAGSSTAEPAGNSGSVAANPAVRTARKAPKA